MEKELNRKSCQLGHDASFISVFILLSISFSFFLIVYYPCIGNDFDYWHMAIDLYSEELNFIDQNLTNVAGYDTLTIVISKITSMPYDLIPMLPLQLLPLIFLLVIFLRNIIDNNSTSHLLIIALVTIILTDFGNKHYFGYWSHGVGFILSLLVISVMTLRIRPKYKSQRSVSLALIIIITIISLNYISYKFTFFTIAFLVGLQVMEWLGYLRPRSERIKRSNLVMLALIGSTYVLSFNKMFYNTFIPRLRISSEVTTSGLYKLFLAFRPIPSDPLSEYYLRTPLSVRYANTIWLLLTLICLLLLAVTIFQKFVRKKNFSLGEIVVSACVISSLLIFIIYTYLGFAEFIFPMFGVIGYGVLLYSNKQKVKKYKYFIITAIVLMLAVNAYETIQLTHNNFRRGKKDWNYYTYMNIPSKWYAKYIIDENSKTYTISKTDVFTGGYFAKEIAYAPRIFSRDDLLFLLGSDVEVSKFKNNSFVINYRLHNFSAVNWETFSSWLNHRELVQSNQYLSAIYSSGEVVIYITTI